ncbi:hypothetical protein [Streptomyces sp. H27-D2]|uniref:hypothetical protein n=1 Tax=Streptomyces sp. H27-D2 TaxID=3046304 RepID=UPI003FA6C901
MALVRRRRRRHERSPLSMTNPKIIPSPPANVTMPDGRPGGALGCPLTDELVNPDGVGRRTRFEHGTIYWSARSGAWPVWGDIGNAWCSLGCEQGMARLPTSYECPVDDQ